MRQRYKILKIPFCEYLPYPHILSKIDFINEHVWYKMDEKKNESDLYIHSQDTIAPLICYESLSSKYVCDLTQQGANIFFVSSSNSFIDSKHFLVINKIYLFALLIFITLLGIYGSQK